MAAEQFFYQPLPPRFGEPDMSTPSYITRIEARIGDIEQRLARIEEMIRKLQP